MLTARQQQLLSFLDAQHQVARSPSFDEMREACGLASKAGIHRMIVALEERGFIRRFPRRVRGIEVIRLPGEDRYDRGYREGFMAGSSAARAELAHLLAEAP